MSIDQAPVIMSALERISEEIRQVRAELAGLRERPAVTEPKRTHYKTSEFAELVGRSEFRVRQWCNHGHINAVKGIEHRGGSALWKIPTDEHARYLNDGLLPMDPLRNKRK
jgi:endonuclease/exonuclease/phosphatase family metal-dependent hydrolase